MSLKWITDLFRGSGGSLRQPLPANAARFVCLSGSKFGVHGVIPASYARFEVSRRRAWGHDVRAYPTTGRDGTAFTVIYTRVAYAVDPGLEVLVTVFEFPTGSALPPDM
ncbi:hypothetical protein [Streptomyces himalayensis]|uniref:Uncharacterized protein n=1 Tax=Streptomyces himalayensis subsp. himalayensis TaxID=2756131 RepID=A0A7W0ICF0_9ACTN|nr:hypothetical protein [Streptomyces himalayensis]MBA2950342.1 hypothetical protein [Streptomyces himalayensis subsp. himalayensis]